MLTTAGLRRSAMSANDRPPGSAAGNADTVTPSSAGARRGAPADTVVADVVADTNVPPNDLLLVANQQMVLEEVHHISAVLNNTTRFWFDAHLNQSSRRSFNAVQSLGQVTQQPASFGEMSTSHRRITPGNWHRRNRGRTASGKAIY